MEVIRYLLYFWYMETKDKRITLRLDDIHELGILAAHDGSNVKNYIENIVVIHVLENGYKKTKRSK